MKLVRLMLLTVSLPLAFAVIQPCFAKTTDFSAVVAAIKAGDYDQAEARIDRVLKAEPDNVNALMYKGNILYYRGSNVGGIQMYGNDDESIYDSSIGYIGEGSSLTTPKVAKQVAIYFRRALAQAPQRMDIQLGLCWTYANAGMKDALIARFPILKKYAHGHQGLQYNMGDYARVIADNYSFADGMAVYRAIEKLYPRDGNIVNDMGAMYFKKGDLRNALSYFTQAAGMKQQDDKTVANLVLFSAVVGDYGKSAYYQKQLSAMDKDTDYILYRALYHRLEGDQGWEKDTRLYMARNRNNAKRKPYVDMARSLLPVSGKYSYQQFQASTNFKVDTQVDLFNYEWGARAFPEQYGPTFHLAELLTYYHNYRKAIPLFAHIEKAGLAATPEQREQFEFYYAWALYRAGKGAQANQYWTHLLEAKQFYRKSAACYFLGNYYYKRKDYKKAADYFARVKDDASKSKYANYASNLYDRIKDKQ